MVSVYNQSISVSKKIHTTEFKLWKFISSPGYLNSSHPFCKENKIISWNKKSHIDQLIYLNNLKYIREFIIWNENEGYTLLIGEKNKKKSKVNWKISSINKETYLTITVYPYFLSSYPKIISFLPYKLYIRPKLEEYLKSVLKGINWYLEKGEKVPRNAFGKHSWFS
tara:strand:- start:47 stop:547 length:501 start_codon:yes stop_codon:yes gene_type:complete